MVSSTALWASLCISLTMFPTALLNAQGGAAANALNDCISQPDPTCDLNTTITEIVAPDSPALIILGLSPNNVSRPESPTELATSVVNGIDEQANIQSGTSIDASPYLVFRAKSVALGRYVDHLEGSPLPPMSERIVRYKMRLLTRSSLSYATSKGTSDPDKAIRLTLGFRSLLWDEWDPRGRFQKCVASIDPDFDLDHPDATNPKLAKQVADCRKAKARVWNSSSRIVAGAPTWISTNGTTGNFFGNGGGYWSSLAKGFGSWGQVTATGRRVTGESVPAQPASSATTPPVTASSAKNTYMTQDTSVLGGMFRFGTGAFNRNVEGLYVHKKRAGLVDNYPEFGFGIERRLIKDFYLEVSYRYPTGTKVRSSSILANLKFSFAGKSQYSTDPKQATSDASSAGAAPFALVKGV